MTTPEDQFRFAIEQAGLQPPKFIKADGKLHRFSSDGKRGDDAGWYVFHAGTIPAGAFGCWRSNLKSTWRADIGRPLTDEEIAANKRKIAEAESKREAAEKKNRELARKRAAKIWESAAEAPADHPYLIRKGVAAHGLRLNHGELVVPMYDAAGVMHNLQFIAADGTKNFLWGGRVSGCHFILGKPNGVLALAEGFATGATVFEDARHAVAIAFNAGNLPTVAKELCGKFSDLGFIVCGDDDVRRPNNSGLKHAREAAAILGGSIAIPDFGESRPETATDFNDLRQHAGPETVRACIERAMPVERTASAGLETDQDAINVNAEIARLAKLRTIDYERERKAAAARLSITRISVLDKLVTAERPPGAAPGQGRSLELPEPEPWPEPVDGAALLDEIEAAIRKLIICDKEAPVAAALWITATWFSDVLEIAPILNLKSPEPRCGKTTFLSLIDRLSCRPLAASSISPAALYRSIEKFSPTLVIDEADAFLTDNEELRGVINSGHTRQNAFVVRTVGDDHEPKRFSTWGFKAIAGIGKRAFTIEDRSISIGLKRKLPNENTARLRHASKTTFEKLARMLARWAQDNKPLVAAARPHVPENLDDRQQDCWEPLFAIAQAAGGAWARKAENAALCICGARSEVSSGSQLLLDIRNIFKERGLEQLSSEVLINSLLAISGSPWPEANRGRAITQNWLATRLKQFEVHPKNIRIGTKIPKGYTLESFADAFARYIHPSKSATPLHGNENNDLDEKQTATSQSGVADEKEVNPLNSNDCSGVADENPQTGDACECADDLPPGDRENSANGHGENEAAPGQSRQDIARALMREARESTSPTSS